MSKTSKRNNFVNIQAIDIILVPFDFSQRDDSNKLKFITVGSLNAEISLFKFLNLKIIKLRKTYARLRVPSQGYAV